jgi:hypothetical protein
MKTNFLSTATFFVLLLVAILVAAGGVAVGWRPFQDGTPELQAVVESHRFSVPIAMLGVPFDEVKDMLVSRVQRKLRWGRLRREFSARTLQDAREIFRERLFDEDFEIAYEQLRFRSRLTDFKDLQGYLSITVHNRGAEDIVGAFLRVPGARFARVFPLVESPGADDAKDGARLVTPGGVFAAQAQGVNRRADDAGNEGEPANRPGPVQGPRIIDADGAPIEDVEDARISLGRLAGGTSIRVDVWLRQYNEGWDWTKRTVLGHAGGTGVVTFHGRVAPMFERFDRNPLIALGAATALLLIAFAIIVLWFAGLFVRGRGRAGPPAA